MGEEAQVTLNTIDDYYGCHDDGGFDDDYYFNQDVDDNYDDDCSYDVDDDIRLVMMLIKSYDVVSFALLIQCWYMVTSICVYGIQIIDLGMGLGKINHDQ